MNEGGVRREVFSAVIGGHVTDFYLLEFADQVMLVVTQVCKLGTMLRARQHPPFGSFTVEVVIGKREDAMLQVCGRQLIEKLALAGSDKDIVLWLGLRDSSAECIRGIVDLASAAGPWAKPPPRPVVDVGS